MIQRETPSLAAETDCSVCMTRAESIKRITIPNTIS